MMTKGEAMLAVPGAELFYRVRGSGPVLLILQGGPGDADGTGALVEELAGSFTVVTYDRRGLSRSRLAYAAETPGIARHGDDAHRVLAALTGKPAFVLGISLGALIGLELVMRHPEQVRLLITHEPAAIDLLPAADRARAVEAHEEVERLYRSGGIPAAMGKMIEMSGVRMEEREPGVELPRPEGAQAARMAANMNFFLGRDAPAAHAYRFDLVALDAAASRIITAMGAASGETIPRLSARALAQRLGREAVEFPGGHSGSVLQPRAFAARLREVVGTWEQSSAAESTFSGKQS